MSAPARPAPRVARPRRRLPFRLGLRAVIFLGFLAHGLIVGGAIVAAAWLLRVSQ